jgi:hypothetical protein
MQIRRSSKIGVAIFLVGYSNKEIAEYFKIAEDTVKHHLSNIFDKIGVSTRLELALFALNHWRALLSHIAAHRDCADEERKCDPSCPIRRVG